MPVTNLCRWRGEPSGWHVHWYAVKPVETNVVGASPNEIRVSIGVDVVDQDGNTAVTIEFEVWVPLPPIAAAVEGGFQPTSGADDVFATIVIEITKADSVAGDVGRQFVAEPACWLVLGGLLEFPPGSKRLAGRGPHAIG